jgi:hypothetical protein
MAYRNHLITTMEQLQSLYGEKMGARHQGNRSHQ